jgi:hypothetical protein
VKKDAQNVLNKVNAIIAKQTTIIQMEHASWHARLINILISFWINAKTAQYQNVIVAMGQTNVIYVGLDSNFIQIVQNKTHYLNAFNVLVDANNAYF